MGPGEDGSAAIARADLLMDIGRPAEAQQLVRSVIAREPDNVDALVTFARAGLMLADPAALPAAEAALALRPDDAMLLRVAALAAAVRTRWTDAERYAAAAIALDPGDPGSHLTRARAALIMNIGMSKALPAAREAVRLSPDDPDALRVLGALLHAIGKSEAGRAALAAALRLDPTHEAARDDLARADAAGFSPVRAADWFAGQVASAPDDRRAAHNLVVVAGRLAGIVHSVMCVAALVVLFVDSATIGRVVASVATGIGVGVAARFARSIQRTLPARRHGFVRFALRRSRLLALQYATVALCVAAAWAYSFVPTHFVGPEPSAVARRVFEYAVLAGVAVRAWRRVTGRSRLRPLL